MQYKLDTLGSTMKPSGCCKSRNKKLIVHDWLSDIPATEKQSEYVEVQFKNTRKDFFHNVENLTLQKGDWVAVESTTGHDIGEVTLTGRLVLNQMNKCNINVNKHEFKKVYRIAKDIDLEKFELAKAREEETMIKSRQIAENLGLNMKIGDVEFQGDGTKAIFYYIAENRVDFRQLIRVLAETFRIKIEMKQIGSRQEAGRIGGIGPCGRELCCSQWMTKFNSVSTNSARVQDLSMNAQKLAGQCGKLKCCLNFEVDTYVDAQKEFPSKEIVLETQDTKYFHFKNDLYGKAVTYSTAPRFAKELVTISLKRAKEVIALNNKGEKPMQLNNAEPKKEVRVKKGYENVVGQDSLTRFDDALKSKKKKRRNKRPYRGKNRENNRRRNETK